MTKGTKARPTIRIPDDYDAAMQDLSVIFGCTKNKLYTEAVAEYLGRLSAKPGAQTEQKSDKK